MRRDPRDETGAMAVLLVLFITVFLLIAGLVVDLGRARHIRSLSQNAADASALAAAVALYNRSATPDFDAAERAAKDFAAGNFDVDASEWGACSDPDHLSYVLPASTSCVSFDSATRPTRVRVRMPVHRVATAFSGVTGGDGVSIVTSAAAFVSPASGSYVILSLDPRCTDSQEAAGLTTNGGAHVFNGNLHSNGSLDGNSPADVAGAVTSVGRLTGTWNATGGTAGSAAPVPDPLVSENIALWRPGSARAAALTAQGRYYDLSNSLITKSMVASRGPGVYYTRRGVDLNDSGASYPNRTFIIDSPTGQFHQNGSTYALSYYDDPVLNPNKILVMTTHVQAYPCPPTHDETSGISLNGSTYQYTGALYAPLSSISLNGSTGTSFDGSIIGGKVQVNGSSLRFSNTLASGRPGPVRLYE